jgi:hypothetical protein
MFFHFKGYNFEFICYFIVHNIILTECHSHKHQLIIPLKCPNLLLETFTEWFVNYIFSFCKIDRTLIYLFKDLKTHLHHFVPTLVCFIRCWLCFSAVKVHYQVI